MKAIATILVLLSASAMADQKILTGGERYTVPKGVVWVIDKAPVSECRVCTADVYVKGDLSQVEIHGVMFNGTFSFSFARENNGPVTLYPGTVFWLGDSRHKLKVDEEKQ